MNMFKFLLHFYIFNLTIKWLYYEDCINKNFVIHLSQSNVWKI